MDVAFTESKHSILLSLSCLVVTYVCLFFCCCFFLRSKIFECNEGSQGRFLLTFPSNVDVKHGVTPAVCGTHASIVCISSCLSSPPLLSPSRRRGECDKDLQLLQEVRLHHRGDGRLLQKHGRGQSSGGLRFADHLPRPAGGAQPGPQHRGRDAQCGERYSRLCCCP